MEKAPKADIVVVAAAGNSAGSLATPASSTWAGDSWAGGSWTGRSWAGDGGSSAYGN